MVRHNLGELEQLILLSLISLGDRAYGAGIRAYLLERTGRSVTPGALYPALDRMEERGLLRSWLGQPTGERGGRAPRHFAATTAGLREAQRVWRDTMAVAADVRSLLEGRGDKS